MFNLANIVCIKLRSNSGKKLNDNQLAWIAYENKLPLEFLEQARDTNYHKIWFEKTVTENSMSIRVVAAGDSRSIDFGTNAKKLPEIIKAQISIIESVRIPKPTVQPMHKPEDVNLSAKSAAPPESGDAKVRGRKTGANPEEKPSLKPLKNIGKKYDLDNILDKINMLGIDGITSEERSFLDSLADEQGETLSFVNPRNRKPTEVSGVDASEKQQLIRFKSLRGWRLPEIDELEAMYHQLHKKCLGNFKDERYWSSTKKNDGEVWYFDFAEGKDGVMSITQPANIRLIR